MNVAKRHGAGDDAPRTFTLVGTPFSTAPEVLRGGGHSFACDWWSFGVLLFEVCAGRPPFPADLKLLHAQARVVHEILTASPPRRPPPPRPSSSRSSMLLVRDEPPDGIGRGAARPPFYAGVRWARSSRSSSARRSSPPVFRYLRLPIPVVHDGPALHSRARRRAPAAAADDGADAEEVAAAALRATLKRGEEVGPPARLRAPSGASLTDPLLSGVAAAEIGVGLCRRDRGCAAVGARAEPRLPARAAPRHVADGAPRLHDPRAATAPPASPNVAPNSTSLARCGDRRRGRRRPSALRLRRGRELRILV